MAWKIGGRDHLRARRVGVRRRRRRAVAARWPEGDPGVGRRRAPDAARSPTPTASTSCPRSSDSARRIGTRARAASIVGLTRNTHDRPRRAGGRRRDGVPDARRARGDAGGSGLCRSRRSRSMAAPRPTRCCCSFKPTCSACRCAGRSCAKRPRSAPRTSPGLAVGYWDGLDDVRRNWALDREFAPSMPEPQKERLYAGWKKAVTRSLAWED